MLKTYLRLAFRNIARKKLYSVINFTGLTAASAFCILVYLYVAHERSFDRFHARGEDLYRVEFSNLDEPKKQTGSFLSLFMAGADEDHMIATPPILAAELAKTFPEIERAVRVDGMGDTKVRVGDHSFIEEKVGRVDPGFLQVFTFPLKSGTTNALLNPNSAVISESYAVKYFGNEDPLGKTLFLPEQDSTSYRITGVMKDMPVNSSFRFDILLSRTSAAEQQADVEKALNTFSGALILELHHGIDPFLFRSTLDKWVRHYFEPSLKESSTPGNAVRFEDFHVYLRKFADAHYNISGGWGHYTNVKTIVQLAGLALVVLIIACVNYVLLTLTSTVSRSQEVGIRKTVGAPRKQIIYQFYVETQLLALLATAGGVCLAALSLPLFNRLTAGEVSMQSLSFFAIAPMLLIIAACLGLFAGVYPAFVMSSLKPLNMLRKFSAYKLHPYFSRLLIMAQFTACLVLVMTTLGMRKQMNFISRKSLGFDKERVLTIGNPFAFADPARSRLLEQRLRQMVAEDPALDGFTAGFLGYNNTNTHVIGGQRVPVEALDIDFNFFDFFRIPLEKGRALSPAIASDSAREQLSDDQFIKGASSVRQPVVVNETLYRMLGSPPLDEINRELGATIVGVCKDYYPDDLTRAVSPAYHRIAKRFHFNYSIRIKAGQDLPQVMDKLAREWKELTAGEPFSFTFLDDSISRNYEAYQRWKNTIALAGVMAIVIACLGVFGFSGVVTVSRVKEIGIRKVLGASSGRLFLQLNISTLITAVLSLIIAVPVAIYLLNSWLQNFAYRTAPGFSIFLEGGLISICCALAAVSYHTIRTARSNPAQSLRSE